MEVIKVRDLAEPTYIKVKDILPGKSGYNMNVKVVSKNVLIDIERIDKTRVVIADFVIGDETGIVKMRLRNENFVDIINEGETITIRNCKVPVVNGHMRMQVDAFGKIEPSQNVRINEVKMDKDMSEVTYDNFAQNRNNRFGGGNRNRDFNYDNQSGYNDNQSNYNDNQSRFNDNKSYQAFSVNDTQSEGTFLSAQIGK